MQVVKFPSRPTPWAHLIWVSTGGIVQSLVDSWDDGPCMMECRCYPNSCTKNAFQWTRKHIPPVKRENHRLESTFWRGYVNFLEGMYFTYWTSSGVFLHTAGVQMCFYILNVVCLQNGLTSVVNQIFIVVVIVCSIWISRKNTWFKHVVLWLVNFELWTMYYHQYLRHQPSHSWVHHFQPLFSSSSCRGCTRVWMGRNDGKHYGFIHGEVKTHPTIIHIAGLCLITALDQQIFQGFVGPPGCPDSQSTSWSSIGPSAISGFFCVLLVEALRVDLHWMCCFFGGNYVHQACLAQ